MNKKKYETIIIQLWYIVSGIALLSTIIVPNLNYIIENEEKFVYKYKYYNPVAFIISLCVSIIIKILFSIIRLPPIHNIIITKINKDKWKFIRLIKSIILFIQFICSIAFYDTNKKKIAHKENNIYMAYMIFCGVPYLIYTLIFILALIKSIIITCTQCYIYLRHRELISYKEATDQTNILLKV